MASSLFAARKRQLARLDGAKPPTPRAAMALAKSQAYQDAADAPATLRAYTADVAHFDAWCGKHGFTSMPATPHVVGAYLAAAGEGYALPTLRRRVAAIARACRVAGHPLDTKHPAIRETLRGIGRKHGTPPRRAAALTIAEIRKLSRACGPDPTLTAPGYAGRFWLTEQEHRSPLQKGRVSRRSGQIEDRRGCMNLQGFQALEGAQGGFGDLPDGAVRAQQLSQLYASQIVFDIAPRIATGVLGHALEQQCDHRQSDVHVDAVGGPVEHRPQLQPALERPPGDLGALQLLVAKRKIGGTQGVIVAVHDELAVEALGGRDGGLIDARDAAAGEEQVAAVAGGGAQVADPLAV